MSGICFQVPPRSRKNIDTLATVVRKSVGVKQPHFPILEFVELQLPLLWENFHLVVQEKHVMGDAHGLTFPESSAIWLREDVYEGVEEGRGRDRFTLAHELGHLVMHGDTGLARVPKKTVELKPYENSEWQANRFAGVLLVPDDVAINLGNAFDIAKACGVSVEAASVRLKQVKSR